MSSQPDAEVRSADWAEALVAEHGEQTPAVPGSDHESREQQVLARIAKARARKPRVTKERITLAHGSGGTATHTLIDAIFLDAFRNPLLEPLEDQAVFAVDAGRMAFTTDSYVVSPLFFPWGQHRRSRGDDHAGPRRAGHRVRRDLGHGAVGRLDRRAAGCV